VYSPVKAARILVDLANRHDFTFYKYQLADLISHTADAGRARAVFDIIETFLEAVLDSIDPATTTVIVTSDHGHLEQVSFSRGHPKGRVPTWYFGPDAEAQASRLRRPEGIFHVIASMANNQEAGMGERQTDARGPNPRQ
jgi:2,3-bisphosphoglycerate-independent phosphoglycerate mutase